jgi:hypothetical protein
MAHSLLSRKKVRMDRVDAVITELENLRARIKGLRASLIVLKEQLPVATYNMDQSTTPPESADTVQEDVARGKP